MFMYIVSDACLHMLLIQPILPITNPIIGAPLIFTVKCTCMFATFTSLYMHSTLDTCELVGNVSCIPAEDRSYCIVGLKFVDLQT